MQAIKDFLSADRRRFSLVLLILLGGVFASALMYWITDQGPGVSPDSTTYIAAARSLLAGNGMFVEGKAMTHYPPAYPLLIALVGLITNGDLLLATRLLASMFFGANLVLLALAAWLCTRKSLVAAGCCILLFTFSAPVILVHSMAWSEAPFMAFSMAGFIFLALHVACPSPYRLLLASLMIGFAVATRYVGFVLFPTVAIALFILSNRSVKHNITDIVIFSGVACLPVISWLIRNMLIAQSATNREFVFHPFILNQFKELINVMYYFVIPTSISGSMKVLHVGVAATLFVLVVRFLFRKKSIKQSTSSVGVALPSILVIYSVLYVTFLFLSISFFDAHTPVDHRLLLPVFFALIIACTSFFKALWEVWSQKWAWYGYVFLVLFSVSINAVPTISIAAYIHHNGQGYTARKFQDSATLAYLHIVPETMTIYSNGPDVIRFLTQKGANMIPNKISPTTLREKDGYQGQMNQIIRECEKGNALIVFFDRITWRWYLPSKEEIESLFSSPLAFKMEDGVIYGLSVVQNRAESDSRGF